MSDLTNSDLLALGIAIFCGIATIVWIICDIMGVGNHVE